MKGISVTPIKDHVQTIVDYIRDRNGERVYQVTARDDVGSNMPWDSVMRYAFDNNILYLQNGSLGVVEDKTSGAEGWEGF